MMNREAWLTQLADAHLWPLIESHGGKRPAAWRVSIGFPKGSRGGKGGHSIGQCWPTSASADDHAEIFVSPELEPGRAADVLLHELIHAALPDAKHGAPFKRMATACGLTGKMTATEAGPDLGLAILKMLAAMPAYPHGVLRIPAGAAKVGPGSRLIKVSCASCDYAMRITRTWLDVAVPVCPDTDCGGHFDYMTVQS